MDHIQNFLHTDITLIDYKLKTIIIDNISDVSMIYHVIWQVLCTNSVVKVLW